MLATFLLGMEKYFYMKLLAYIFWNSSQTLHQSCVYPAIDESQNPPHCWTCVLRDIALANNNPGRLPC